MPARKLMDSLTIGASELTQLVIEKYRGNLTLTSKLITLVHKLYPWGLYKSNIYHECTDNLIKCLLGEEDLGVLAPYHRTYLCKALLLDLHELMNMVDHPIPLVKEVVLWRLSGQEEQFPVEGHTQIENWKKAEGFSSR